MGQKVNPNGFRIGVNKDWSSQWYADKKTFSQYIFEDNEIRKVINKIRDIRKKLVINI